MVSSKIPCVSTALIVAAMWSSPAAAQTVVAKSGFTSGGTFDTPTGSRLIRNNISTFDGWGVAFLPSSSKRLDRIDLAIDWTFNPIGSSNFDVKLVEGNNPNTGAVVDQGSVAAPTAPSAGAPSTFVSALNPLLDSTKLYWILARPLGVNSWNWYESADVAGVQAEAAFSNSTGFTWTPVPVGGSAVQFRVTALDEATAVPEPVSMALLVPGLGAIALVRRRRGRSA